MVVSDEPFNPLARSADAGIVRCQPVPGGRRAMPAETDGSPRMREAECPFCERVVLVYEDPPRCPLCACPLDEERMRDHLWPGEGPAPLAP